MQWTSKLADVRRRLLKILLDKWHGKRVPVAAKEGLQCTVEGQWADEQDWPFLELGKEQLLNLGAVKPGEKAAADLPRQTKKADSGVLVMLYMNLRAHCVPLERWGELFAGVGAADTGDALRIKAVSKGLIQLSTC